MAQYPPPPAYGAGTVIYSSGDGSGQMMGSPPVVYVQAAPSQPQIISSGGYGQQPMMMQQQQPMMVQQQPMMAQQQYSMQPIVHSQTAYGAPMAYGSQPQMVAMATPVYMPSAAYARGPTGEGQQKAAKIMKEGLFSCFDDAETCFCAFFCTPCAVGTNMERAGKGQCLTWGCLYFCGLYFQCPCVCGMMARQNIQRASNVPLTEVENCLLHTFCCPCAIAQEGRAAKALEDSRSRGPVAQTMN